MHLLMETHENEEIPISENLVRIQERFSAVREQVYGLMEDKYVNFVKINCSDSLIEEVVELLENIENLSNYVVSQTKVELNHVKDELESVTDSLMEAKLASKIVKILLDIENESVALERKLAQNRFHQGALQALRLRSLFEENLPELENLNFLDDLQQHIGSRRHKMLNETLESWNKSVKWTASDESSQNLNSSLIVNANKAMLEDIIMAVDVFGFSDEIVREFGRKLFQELVFHCIVYKTTVGTSYGGYNSSITVDSEKREVPKPREVIDNIKTIFEFLVKVFDLKMSEGETFLSAVSVHTKDEFLLRLEEQCLCNAIPTERKELSSYQLFVDELTILDEFLTTIGYLNGEDTILKKYRGNIEEQFLAKIIESYLSKARDLCKMSIHNAFEVNYKVEAESVEGLSQSDQPFGENSALYPSCQVSQSAKLLVDLVRSILDKIINEDNSQLEVMSRLFTTAKDLITMYTHITVVAHAKLLDNLPHQSALFHNSCFYIGNELTSVHEYYRLSLPLKVKNTESLLDGYSDLVNKGTKVLDAQVSKQEKLLLTTVAESGLSSLSEFEALPVETQKGLKRCVHLLTYLQSLWQNVLTISVYNKVMGQLSNALLLDIISRVIQTKDIGAETARHLVEALTDIQSAIPQLFQEPKQVHRFVAGWYKFKELIIVLGASLYEIRDRWAAGKGPLAIEFTATQLRSLIKALFQVTDRRAAVLAEIK